MSTADALTWAVYNFRYKAMQKTGDQLQSECDAIESGQARLVLRDGWRSAEVANIVWAEDEKVSRLPELYANRQQGVLK